MAVITRINTTIEAALTDVDSILNYASYGSLFPVYAAVKGFICCNFADVLGNMWVALTLAGEQISCNQECSLQYRLCLRPSTHLCQQSTGCIHGIAQS